jgi:hypothetical protein
MTSLDLYETWPVAGSAACGSNMYYILINIFIGVMFFAALLL